MKRKLYLILFLISNLYGVQAQQLDQVFLNCQYRLQWINDTSRPEKIKDDLLYLEIGRKISKFYSYNNYIADSLLHADEATGMSMAEILANRDKYAKTSNKYVIYTDYPTGKITVTENLLKDHFRYEEDKIDFAWYICTDTCTILSYLCQKATCHFRGREYIAWFTPEIPLNRGPWKFSGLPGLILKIEDTRRHYRFECVFMEKKKAPMVWIDKPYTQTTRQKFNQYCERYFSNPLTAFSSMGITFKPVGGKMTPKKGMPYNPLELSEE